MAFNVVLYDLSDESVTVFFVCFNDLWHTVGVELPKTADEGVESIPVPTNICCFGMDFKARPRLVDITFLIFVTFD